METEKRNSLSSLLLAFGAAAVLLTPLVVYVVLRSHEEGAGMRQVEAAAAENTGRKEQRPRSARREFAPAEEDVRKPARRPSPAPRALIQQPPLPPVQPFPSPSDVPVGMDKSKLLASFGRPNMRTTEVTEGRALETFRYLRPELGVETTVFLRSGRVVGASSTYY